MTDHISRPRNIISPNPTQLGSDDMSEELEVIGQTHQSGWTDTSLSVGVDLPVVSEVTHQGPSKAQWDVQRATITQLYETQKKHLKDVMQHMASIGFHASENMYKKRIRQWGLDKKFKRHEVIAMLVLQAHYKRAGKSLRFTIRGKEVDQQDLERYVKRSHINQRDLLSLQLSEARCQAPDVILRFLPNVPRHLNAPDHFNRLDALVHTLASYLQAAFDSGLCWADKRGSLQWRFEYRKRDNQQLDNFCFIGRDELRRGRPDKAGVAFRSLFWTFEKLMHNTDPEHWMFFLQIRYDMVAEGLNDLEQALSKHIFSLGRVYLDRQSPHRALVAYIAQLQMEELEECRRLCCSVLLDVLQLHVSRLSLLVTYGNMFRSLDYHVSAPFVNEAQTDYIDVLRNPDSSETEITHSANTLYDLWRNLHPNQRPDPTELVQHLLDAASRISSAWEHAIILVVGAGMLEHWSYHHGDYERSKALRKKLILFCTEYERRRHEKLISDHTLYFWLKYLEDLSSHTGTRDDNQRWQRMMEAIEKTWEDELNEAVGHISLDDSYEDDQAINDYSHPS